jgi:predicted nucleic acid-binding protein
MTTFLDTSALLAALKPGEPHHGWSAAQLEARRADGPLIIADIVYGEFSISMDSREATDEAVRELALERLACSDDVLYRAGQAYKEYRRRNGTKTNVLPDFLIGALAAIEGAPLVTTNAKDFLGYFPELQIISP